MRNWLAPAAGFILASLISGRAHADQPWYADDHTDLHEPWSFSPLFGGGLGGSSDSADLVTALELALRWRYGRPPDDRHGHRMPILTAFGAALATTDVDSLEPSAFIGAHFLPDHGSAWSQELYLNLRLDVGGGYRFADEARPSGAIAYAKAALGLLFARRVKYARGSGERSYTYTKDRFRTELDLVGKAQVDAHGEWMVIVGLELDPLRIGPDVGSLILAR